MKTYIIALALGAAAAVNVQSLGPAEEFAARRQELREWGQDKTAQLTDKWLRRVDGYDPDIDQEMATEIMNASKRVEAIRRLKAKKANTKWWWTHDNEEDTDQMLKTLEKEQEEYEKKNGSEEIL